MFSDNHKTGGRRRRVGKRTRRHRGGSNPWLDHVKAVKAQNPGKKLKEILKMAKKTYHK